MDTAPMVIDRTKFDRWCIDRRLNDRQVGELLNVSRETARRLRLPFGDPKRRKPDEHVLEKIVAVTRGDVTAGDFYPPHLNGEAIAQTGEVAR